MLSSAAKTLAGWSVGGHAADTFVQRKDMPNCLAIDHSTGALPESLRLIIGTESLRLNPPPPPEVWRHSAPTLNQWLAAVLARGAVEPAYVRPDPDLSSLDGLLPPCPPGRHRVHLALSTTNGKCIDAGLLMTIDVLPDLPIGAALVQLALDADTALHTGVPYPRIRVYPLPEDTAAASRPGPQPLPEHIRWSDLGPGGPTVLAAKGWAHGPCDDPDGVFTAHLHRLWAKTPAAAVLTPAERAELVAFKSDGRGDEAERSWSRFVLLAPGDPGFHCGGFF